MEPISSLRFQNVVLRLRASDTGSPSAPADASVQTPLLVASLTEVGAALDSQAAARIANGALSEAAQWLAGGFLSYTATASSQTLATTASRSTACSGPPASALRA